MKEEGDENEGDAKQPEQNVLAQAQNAMLAQRQGAAADPNHDDSSFSFLLIYCGMLTTTMSTGRVGRKKNVRRRRKKNKVIVRREYRLSFPYQIIT